MVKNLNSTLARMPSLTGDRFTAADLLVGGAVNFAVRFTKAIAETPTITGFLERTVGRPAFARAMAMDRQV